MMIILNINKLFYLLKYILLKDSFIIKIVDNRKEF